MSSNELDDAGWIDSIAVEQRPPKRQRKTQDIIKKELEDNFLTPSRSFNTHWLNKLQQRWDAPTNYRGLFQVAPTQTRTIIRFTREGLEGRVTGYKEVTVPANSATAKTPPLCFASPPTGLSLFGAPLASSLSRRVDLTVWRRSLPSKMRLSRSKKASERRKAVA
jgi:antiviral helicase SKI2